MHLEGRQRMLVVRRHEDHQRRIGQRRQLGGIGQAVLARHLNVEQHQVGRTLHLHHARLGGAGGQPGHLPVGVIGERQLQIAARQRLVVNDQYVPAWHRGFPAAG
jgi:hypothetical protein